MDLAVVHDLLEVQAGVVSRAQLLERGATPADIERLRRRRELAGLLPGVFVDHTGAPTWIQRAWGGCLALWPAALDRQSALRAFAGPGWRPYSDASPIQVAVDRPRRVLEPPGYRVRRVIDLDQRAQWHLGPPRLRVEEAALDAAVTGGSRLGQVQLLADLCQARRTTAGRMLAALQGRRRIADRAWLEEVLADIAEGSCSVLERGFLTEVERPHGLPVGVRQHPRAGHLGLARYDVLYEEYGLVVELDGRLFHDSARQRDRDLDRDLDAAVDGRLAVRLGWGQVFGRRCATARRLGLLLRQRGYRDTMRSCGEGCVMPA